MSSTELREKRRDTVDEFRNSGLTVAEWSRGAAYSQERCYREVLHVSCNDVEYGSKFLIAVGSSILIFGVFSNR
jgi:hypothetical protein